MPPLDDDLDAPYGLTIHIHASLGGEQSFQLTGDILTFKSTGPIYEWASGRVQLSQEQVEALFALLAKVRIGPILTEPTIGLDGETTTVTISQGQNKVELEYWAAPKAWKPLEKSVEMVRELAERAIAKERMG